MRKPIEYTITPSGCHECTSHSPRNRYPGVERHGKHIGLHRLVYEEKFGSIPPGMFITHKCNNPRCINLDHLRLGTPLENTADRRANGTWPSGEGNAFHKLTWDEVRSIRRLYHRGDGPKLARIYGVDESTVRKIIRGDMWADAEARLIYKEV